MSQSYELIRIDRKDALATLWMNHQPLNVLNFRMMDEMIRAIAEIRSDEQIRLMILRAQGNHFSAGMDVADHLPDKVHCMFQKMHELFLSIRELDVPTITALNGNALGGGLELAVMTDLAYSIADAKMGQPEIKLGIFPPLAVAYFPELIGARNAYDLILSGRSIHAEEALRMGLINGVFQRDEFEGCIQEITNNLLQYSRATLAITKKAFRRSLAGLVERLTAVEEIYLQELMRTEDAREGLEAFLQKRKPEWKHR